MNDREAGIRKGQATNLAINDAIAARRADDMNYVLKRYVHYYNLCAMLQGLSIEDVEKLLEETK
jgi:hypothetical protein